MARKITYKPFGEYAIIVEWDSLISDEILKDILHFKNKIAQFKKGKCIDLIVGYNSLTLMYASRINDYLTEIEGLKAIYEMEGQTQKQPHFLWTIPVCYDLEFGIDLEDISKNSQISINKIIALHTQKSYRVFFIGFLPGFLYLGGLDIKLFYKRKANPRLQVAKGAVAIGGKQTGIYPTDSAGGWNIIGKTPISFFDVKKEEPCFAKAGDKIQFQAISMRQFRAIEESVLQGNYQLNKTLLND